MLTFLYLIIGLMILIFIYGTIKNNNHSAQSSDPGEIINIGNSKLRIYGQNNDNPTIVMILGLDSHSSHSDLSSIQKELDSITQTCIYERSNYTPSNQKYRNISDNDSNNITEELYILLKKAANQPPYILVGHSMGAMECLLYAQEYPEEIAGVVLIDGGNPYSYDYIDNKIERNAFSSIDTNLKNKNEINRDIPLVVLTSGGMLRNIPKWKESQAQLTNWSKNSKQIIIEDSGHYIHIERPEKIIHAILELIEKHRKEQFKINTDNRNNINM